jgi:hypothetical protein
MDQNEFNLGLMADPIKTKEGTRIRVIVSDALSERAKERQKEGRPDIAGRLRWAAGRLYGGQFITKRVLTKLRKDIEIVEKRLVDGISNNENYS